MPDAFGSHPGREEIGEIKLTQPQMRLPPAGAPLQTTKQQAHGLSGRDPELAVTSPQSSVQRVRPRFRPPVLLLCVIDDGGTTGEWHRLRADTFLVGRSEGDLQIPHDAGLSARHFEFRRVFKDGIYRWQLHDINSTNGTFVRIDKARLSDGRFIILGNRRYRFDDSSAAADMKNSAGQSPSQRETTQAWHIIGKPDAAAELVCLGPEEEGKAFPLAADEQFIGSKPGNSQVVVNDNHLDPRHAKIFRDGRKRWWISDESTTNGTWVNAQQVWLDRTCEILAGEQRFLAKVPE